MKILTVCKAKLLPITISSSIVLVSIELVVVEIKLLDNLFIYRLNIYKDCRCHLSVIEATCDGIILYLQNALEN